MSRVMKVNFDVIDDSRYHISRDQIEKEFLIVQQSIKDPSKFQMLYDKYFEVIFRFIFRRVDDENTTADITSQVFYKALKNLKKYRFKGVPFSAWLYRIATNEVAVFYKSNKRRQVFSLEEERFQEIVGENLDDRDVDYSDLIHAMKVLSEGEAEILELRFFEEKPFAEIAFILDISEANAKMRTYRSLEKLKHQLLTKVK